MDRYVVTLGRFILEEERQHPGATGALTSILYDLALAAKLVHREVSKAGLVDILGQAGHGNVHGEEVQKLDDYAHEVVFNAMDHGGNLCVMASEEEEGLIPIPAKFPTGDYVLLFDPLDGSSNIDANISIGTIFSIHRRVTEGRDGTLEDCLQPGHRQVAAGYVMYGSSTVLVYTTGNGVHGFTLDPSIGEFLLSHSRIRLPDPGKRIYSVNEGNFARWTDRQKELVEWFRGSGPNGGGGFSQRYVGSLVADFHRTLLYGGVFMYPGDRDKPRGKLRLLYEAAPLAFLCEQAGGRATDGAADILSLQPQALHERTPLFMGNRRWVDLAGEVLAGGPLPD
ncbi:MAG: class 1 fructose-bisphosphatase [Gemmatimonadota bacterium]|nr:class 1 fructose-bisphosphatase [Gemmatimonadota bacterium]